MTTQPRRDELSPAEREAIWAAAAREIRNAPPATPAQLALVESAAGPALRASYVQAPHLTSEDAA